MKKLLYILAFIPFILRGQLSPVFSIYREQTSTLNPAMPTLNYLVSEYNHSISATYRYQWMGVEGAPTTQVVHWEYIPTDKNILVGAHLMNDKTGEIGTTGINGQFAYKMSLSRTENKYLLIGMSVGVQSFRANLSQIAAIENISVANTQRTLFDLNMGAYYQHGKSYYIGISTPQLLGSKIYLNSSDRNIDYALNQNRQIYAVIGKYFDAPFFGNDGAYLEPNIWLRYLTDSRQLSFDVNLRAKISNSFWVGSGYNLFTNTLNIEIGSILAQSIGLKNGQMKVGFGFGVPMGTRWTGLGPIGELFVAYAWGNRE